MFNAAILSALVLLGDPAAAALDAVTNFSFDDDSGIVEAVVYGQVVSVEPDNRPPKSSLLTLRVACTLTGPYDAAASPVLRAHVSFTGRQGEERYAVLPGFDLPKPNAWVLARLRAGAGGFRFPWCIVYSLSKQGDWTGVPAIAEVKGFDDPKVNEITSRLAKIRAAKPLGEWGAARQAIDAEWANMRAPRTGIVALPPKTSAGGKTPAGEQAVPGSDRKSPLTPWELTDEPYLPPQAVMDFLRATGKPEKLDPEMLRQLLEQMNNRTTEPRPKSEMPKKE